VSERPIVLEIHPRAAYAIAAAMLLAAPAWVAASSVTLPHSFVNGTVADADAVNANFSAIDAAVDDNHARLTDVENKTASLTGDGAKIQANASASEWPIRIRSTNSTPTHRAHLLVQRSSANAPVTAGHTLGGLAVGAMDEADSYTAGWNGGAEITAYAAEDWSPTAHGTDLALRTTANGGTAPQPRLVVSADGAIDMDGVQILSWAGNSPGNTTWSQTFHHDGQAAFEITAIFNHYGYLDTYGTMRSGWGANHSAGVFQFYDDQNITSGNAGSWSISQSSDNGGNAVTITHNAGTYNGGGHWFVRVVGNGNLRKP
jgi:hypothetical protein